MRLALRSGAVSASINCPCRCRPPRKPIFPKSGLMIAARNKRLHRNRFNSCLHDAMALHFLNAWFAAGLIISNLARLVLEYTTCLHKLEYGG